MMNTTLAQFSSPSAPSAPAKTGRVQSPSSIITYNQCPRKYYYRYHERLPSPKSIHLIRGSLVHEVLEHIYDLDTAQIPDESFLVTLRVVLHENFRKTWLAASDELAELGLSPEELDGFYAESRDMVSNFFHYLKDRMRPHLSSMTPREAFAKVTPKREVLMKSARHNVQGYIDAIQEEGLGEKPRTVILDYKTSKKLEITPEYRQQLGIYAMLHEEHSFAPEEVAIFFLKHGQELRLPVTFELIEEARAACRDVGLRTTSTQINDYPKRPGPLCKYSSGQCEYYGLCFEGRTPQEHRELVKIRRH